MPVIKRKTGKSHTRSRRAANMKINAPELVECPQCHSMKQPHRVCPECGYYDGKEVLQVD